MKPFDGVLRRCSLALPMLLAAAGAADSATPKPAMPAGANAAVQALARDYSATPAEVLARLQALSATLAEAAPPVQDHAQLLRIQALLDAGRIAEAETLAQALMVRLGPRATPLAHVRARLGMLRVRLRQSNLRQSEQLAREILARRLDFADDALAAELFYAIGTALSRKGEHPTAVALFIDGIKAADRWQRLDQKAYLLIGLCGINYDLRDIDKALQYCQQGAAIAEDTGNKLARAAAAINLSLCHAARNDDAGQLRELETSLSLATEMGLKRAEAMAHINLADYAFTRNDMVAGMTHCQAGLRLGRELSDPVMIGVSLTNLGTATAALGDIARGVALYEQGVKEVETANERSYLVAFLPGMADLYEQAGRMPEALAALRRQIGESAKLYEQSQADALAQLQAKYDADLRQREIRLLTLDNALKTAALERRSLQMRLYWLIGALLTLITAALVLAYRRVHSANRALAVENTELELHLLSDALTGVYNRRALDTLLEARSAGGHAQDTALAPMAFVMIDVDRFKLVNDTYGHGAGDAVLIELAHRLSRLVRPNDKVFRLGGEEFLLLLTNLSNHDLSRLCARVLAAASSEAVVTDTASIPITLSLGACRFPLSAQMPFAEDWSRHLRLADLALYRSKRSGRNRGHQIVSVRDGCEATLDRIETDFSYAREAGLIEVVEIVLPEPIGPEIRSD